MKKPSNKINLSNFDDKILDKALANDLQLAEVKLKLVWSESRDIMIFKIHLKSGKNDPVDILQGTSSVQVDNYEEIILGSFASGTELEVSFGALALMEVPKAIGVVTQSGSNKAYQVDPKDIGKTTKIESGKKWDFTFKYVVL